MRKVITGYGRADEVGIGGDKLLDEIVETAKENLGAKVEAEGDAEETNLFRVTIIVENVEKLVV